MSPDDFIKNNRGIDDGKDVPEEYLRSLYERISRNEIKMKEVDLETQQRQAVNPNRLLGLDSILNIVIRKRGEDSNMETSDDLIRRMQEQFKEKARKTEYVLQYFPILLKIFFLVQVHFSGHALRLTSFYFWLEESSVATVHSPSGCL